MSNEDSIKNQISTLAKEIGYLKSLFLKSTHINTCTSNLEEVHNKIEGLEKKVDALALTNGLTAEHIAKEIAELRGKKPKSITVMQRYTMLESEKMNPSIIYFENNKEVYGKVLDFLDNDIKPFLELYKIAPESEEYKYWKNKKKKWEEKNKPIK